MITTEKEKKNIFVCTNLSGIVQQLVGMCYMLSQPSEIQELILIQYDAHHTPYTLSHRW